MNQSLLNVPNQNYLMPIIDVSQKFYRALVRAAHRRGMSIDRFIQAIFEISSDIGKSMKTSSAPVATLAGAQVVHSRSASQSHSAALAQVSTDTGVVFDGLWNRVEKSAGKVILTKRGQYFTYEVNTGYLTVVESDTRIPRSQFKKALGQWPQNGPSNLKGIYAASVVWAILADEQILDNAA